MIVMYLPVAYRAPLVDTHVHHARLLASCDSEQLSAPHVSCFTIMKKKGDGHKR